MSSIAQRIEDFAKETLLSVINGETTETLDAEGPISELRKVMLFFCAMWSPIKFDFKIYYGLILTSVFKSNFQDSESEKPFNELPSLSANSKDVSSDTHQSCTSQSGSALSVCEAQRCMSLYFALCTKVIPLSFTS